MGEQNFGKEGTIYKLKVSYGWSTEFKVGVIEVKLEASRS